MTNGNKTLYFNCRFLSAEDFSALHRTFLEAFSDYVIPFQLSEEQFKNHITQNSVELEKSVGAFSGDRMVGCTLNGFGVWNGKKTVYDAGTGVIPAFRNQGVGKAIFDFMTPDLREDGFEQLLLEVISHNEKAVRLYQKLEFETARRLVFFEQKEPLEFASKEKFEIREITDPDWDSFESFADGKTSWQNSFRAIDRTARKVILGAFRGENCVGYGIIFPNSGIISQIAVDREFRRNGAASMILREMKARFGENKSLRASNVDEKIAGVVDFLKQRGFIETISQLEMIKIL